ncbi:MAG: hypothetical protein JXD23_06220 [Spirochaetales bacterium]|nr:hypothetical protein [Spirochaetales bacterium]
MADWLSLIEKKASDIIPGATYNAFRSDLEGRGEGPDLFYEISLKPEMRWEEFRDSIFPRLARHLKSKSINPEKAGGIVVSAFVGDRCFVIGGTAFLDVFKEMEGAGEASFHERILSWLSQDEEAH